MDSTLGLPKSSMSSISATIDSQSDNESIDTPLVSPFLDSDDELDDGEVLNELDEYGNARNFYLALIEMT
ncbi:hypothetical protein Tco_1466485 [Tanacetum coccineum]